MSENERATRAQRIDPKLRSAGWPVIDRVWPSPASPAAVVEYETAHGPADYALCQQGSVQAVVEAKKITVGPQGHGDVGSPRYGDRIQRKPIVYSPPDGP